MTLYADILAGEYADDDEVELDEASGTWTVKPWQLEGEQIPGIPNKEMALVIVRAIRAGFQKGVDMAYSACR